MTHDEDDDDLDFARDPLPRATLSAAGERRREEMLRLLSGAVVARRRRRTTARVAAAAAIGVATAFAAFRALDGPEPAETTPSPVVRAEDRPALPVLAHVRVDRVETDPRVLDATLVATESGIAARSSLDDAALLEILAAAGHETGLVRFGDRVMLTEPAGEESEETGDDGEGRGI